MENNQRIRILESEADNFFDSSDVFKNRESFFSDDVFESGFEQRLSNPFSSSFFTSDTSNFKNQDFFTKSGICNMTNEFKYSDDGKSWSVEVKLGNKTYSNIK